MEEKRYIQDGFVVKEEGQLTSHSTTVNPKKILEQTSRLSLLLLWHIISISLISLNLSRARARSTSITTIKMGSLEDSTVKGLTDPNNKTLEEPPQQYLLHRSFVQKPYKVLSASGLDLHLSTGETVLDACGGAAVSVIGHGNQEVEAAILEQVRKVSYIHTQAYTTSSAEDLATEILRGNKHGLEKAFFVGSGSEAVEAAMKLARQYFYEKGEPQRVHFVSRRQSYHGNTMASMSISANIARKVPYQGFSYPHVSHVDPPYAYRYKRDGESEAEFSERLVRELEEEFLRVGADRVIAFIAEPVIGATAGCVTPPRGYLSGVRRVCDKYGVLLILDEIMCGTGRCGTYYAFEAEAETDTLSVAPDIVTLAKGLGGGYAAIAGILINTKVINALRQGTGAFVHGHTYQAHPVSCAAALAVQRILRRDDLVARCAAMGDSLSHKLHEALGPLRSVGNIRGRGLFWAVEFVRDRESKATFDPAVGFGLRVQQAAFEAGVAIYPGSGTVDGKRGDHVLLAPPYTVTEEQLETTVGVLKGAIESQEKLYLR